MKPSAARDDNGSDQDIACDAELVMDFDLLFVDGTFGCESTRNHNRHLHVGFELPTSAYRRQP